MPFSKNKSINTERYILSQVDIGGFNNIKMVFENYIVAAYLTNRRLILPPPKKFYLVDKDQSEITDFINLEVIKRYINIISCRTKPLYINTYDEYERFIKNNCYKFSSNNNSIISYDGLLKLNKHKFITYNDRYLDYWQCNHKCSSWHFKKLQDIIGYNIPFVNIITKTVDNLIQNSILKKGFNALHIRKGDFQWETINKLSLDVIYNKIKYIFDSDTVLYILTDHTDKTFFKELYNNFSNIMFFSDFNLNNLTQTIDKQYLPMIDMELATRANIFVGTRLSTFSGNIQIMRGYRKKKLKLERYNTTNYIDSILYTSGPDNNSNNSNNSNNEAKSYPSLKDNNDNNNYLDIYYDNYPVKNKINGDVKICSWSNVYKSYWE